MNTTPDRWLSGSCDGILFVTDGSVIGVPGSRRSATFLDESFVADGVLLFTDGCAAGAPGTRQPAEATQVFCLRCSARAPRRMVLAIERPRLGSIV